MDVAVSRKMWQLFEPLHVVLYFAPEARAALDAVGMRGYWMGYVAARIAPMGAVAPAVVDSVFYGFHPSRSHRALPDAWGFASPEEVLDARLAGSTEALRGLLGTELVGSSELGEAAELAWAASQYAETAGRVLGAANQVLPRPDEPLAALWQATATLREHRGDAHVACLVAHDVGPVQAHVLKAACDEVDEPLLKMSRAWPEEAWTHATEELADRGLLDLAGAVTTAGRQLHDDLERATDAAALSPWRGLGEARTDRLAALLDPLARRVEESGVLPWPNPIGLPRLDG